jgi:hypothetical protein
MRWITLALVAIPPLLPGCGPDGAWNCDVGAERCRDAVLQACALDHADTTPDGTIAVFIGKRTDKGTCRQSLIFQAHLLPRTLVPAPVSYLMPICA